MYDIVTIVLILIGIGIIILSYYKDKEKPVVVTKRIKDKDVNLDHYEEYGARIEELNNKILELNEYGTFLKSELDKKHKELLFLYQIIHEKTKEINSENEVFSLKDDYKNTENKLFNNINEINEPLQNKVEQIQENAEQPIKNAESSQITVKPQGINNNKIILQLSDRGYSITDIAQMLNIGQGEVKLVLDLFE